MGPNITLLYPLLLLPYTTENMLYLYAHFAAPRHETAAVKDLAVLVKTHKLKWKSILTSSSKVGGGSSASNINTAQAWYNLCL